MGDPFMRKILYFAFVLLAIIPSGSCAENDVNPSTRDKSDEVEVFVTGYVKNANR